MDVFFGKISTGISFFKLLEFTRTKKRKETMPTKKTIKKTTVKKTAVKKAPVMEHECECGKHCHCHGGAHWVKHIVVWAIIFALGMVCGKMFCCGGHGMKHMPKMHPVFVEGCLDMESIKCPKMQEKLATADVDGNQCISVEEYKAVKKEMRKEMRAHKKGLFGKKGPRKPMPTPEAPEAPEVPVAE